MRETKREIMANVADVVSSKIVAPNTIEYYRRDGARVIRLHQTDIITFIKGRVILNSGGWQTVTTKDRINRYAPTNIFSKSGIWYVGNHSAHTAFYDGITLQENGSLPLVKPGHEKKQEKLVADIKRFVSRLYKLAELPKPENGDCWYCLMFDQVASRDASHGNIMRWHTEPAACDKRGKRDEHDHLNQHIKEGYIPGALLVNAMRSVGYKDIGISMFYQMDDKKTFARALRRYMRSQLGLPA